MRMTPGQTITAQCLLNVSADETLGPWIDVRGCANIVLYQSSTGTTSAGVITFEEAAPGDVTASNPVVFGAGEAAYSSITTSNASDTSAGKQKAIHVTIAGYWFVRARISTAVTGGGTVSVVLVAY